MAERIPNIVSFKEAQAMFKRDGVDFDAERFVLKYRDRSASISRSKKEIPGSWIRNAYRRLGVGTA